MEYRHGTCSSCQAHYRVPATFKADKAKCKKCDGVVEIGPPSGGDDAPAGDSAKKPRASKKGTARKPAGKARTGSTRPKATAKPAPKTGTPRGGSKDSVRSTAEAAAGRVRDTGSSSRRPRRQPKPKPKKNWGVLIGVLVVFVVIAFGAVYFLNQRDSEATETATEVAAVTPEAPETAAEEEAMPDEPPPPEEAPVEEEEPVQAEDEAPVVAGDPSSIDLSLLNEQAKLDETTEEEWAGIRELVATFTDPDIGAAGNRARAQLLELGRVAFPALLNVFKRVDVTSQEGYRTGDLIQRLLMEICRGNNFEWRYTTEAKDAYFNKRVIQRWFKSWEQVVEQPKAWIQLGKLTEEEGAEYMAAFESPADIGVSDDMDDF